MNKLSLYIHIPFCRKKCSYCDFYSVPNRDDIKKAYISSLINQIKSTSFSYPVKTIYYGGGTPSLLEPSEFYLLQNEIYKKFKVDSESELTFELNPESTSEGLLQMLKSCGVNRLSLGIQSFNNNELKALGRIHDKKSVVNALSDMRKFGFSNISTDLMLGIPLQDKKSLEKSLEECVFFKPEHISVYILKIEKNTPIEKSGFKELSEELQEELYLFTDDFLLQKGYSHYEISNFAKEGFRSRHNLVYWQGGEYLAFGPGAHGYLDGVRYFYSPNLQEYINLNGLVQKQTEETLFLKDTEQEKIMLSLRLSDGLQINDVNNGVLNFFILLQKEGLAKITTDRIFLTPKGFLVSNSIIVKTLDLSKK